MTVEWEAETVFIEMRCSEKMARGDRVLTLTSPKPYQNPKLYPKPYHKPNPNYNCPHEARCNVQIEFFSEQIADGNQQIENLKARVRVRVRVSVSISFIVMSCF